MEETTEKAPETFEGTEGAFGISLFRNNKQIKRDRAIMIIESAEMLYKRTVEDIEHDIKQLKRDREAMLDLSPTDAHSLTMPSDFDAKKFVEKDIKFGGNIRNNSQFL